MGSSSAATSLTRGYTLDVGRSSSCSKVALMDFWRAWGTISDIVLLSVNCLASCMTRRVMVMPLEGPRNLDSSVSWTRTAAAPRMTSSASGSTSSLSRSASCFSSSRTLCCRRTT